jgi:hypothetical protein
MGNGKFLHLVNINWELIEVCRWLRENENTTLESMIAPLKDELTQLVLALDVSDSGAVRTRGINPFALDRFTKAKLMRQL